MHPHHVTWFLVRVGEVNSSVSHWWCSHPDMLICMLTWHIMSIVQLTISLTTVHSVLLLLLLLLLLMLLLLIVRVRHNILVASLDLFVREMNVNVLT